MSQAIDRVAASLNGIVLLLGRLALAAIFVPSGFNKLTHLGRFAESLAARGMPASYGFAILGASVELVGSLMVVLGLKTRHAALLMALFTAVAALISHHFWNMPDAVRTTQYIQFMKNLAIIGGFLLLFAAGPGPWSLDRRGK